MDKVLNDTHLMFKHPPFLVDANKWCHNNVETRKDKWCNMAHSVVYYQAWVRWLLCNDIIPKAIPLSERLAHCPYLASHPNTKKLAELARIHRL